MVVQPHKCIHNEEGYIWKKNTQYTNTFCAESVYEDTVLDDMYNRFIEHKWYKHKEEVNRGQNSFYTKSTNV